MQTNSRTESKTHDFKPIDTNVAIIDPDAEIGGYEAKIDNVKVSATSKDGYPMLIVDYKIVECKDGQDEKNVDAVVSDFLAFFPDGDRRGRMAKLKVRQICEAVGFDLESFPTAMRSKKDFDEVVHAWKGKTIDIWVGHREDKETGETRVNVAYSAPRGGMAAMNSDEDEDDKPRRSSGKPPQKKTARR